MTLKFEKKKHQRNLILNVSRIHMQICHMRNVVPETDMAHNRFVHSPNN